MTPVNLNEFTADYNIQTKDIPFWADTMEISEWQLRNIIFLIGPCLKDIVAFLRKSHEQQLA